ncbi:bZIP transcription factor [Aspergillus novofumigatus IBT 16806]|uniref:BZIP domain-containing protein n=1 Tax=Aspergillus novofumigatus (strain IBT 16806) TaxID=1392255 RepID=A0A2I1CH32_ASPN1|nr:uncharacterized protein P174DRAFT_457656 [Aspergillus novofumigatus IBT 16806]PKX96914.1 hypothetical protein P174DRAFT_457656 [Aspergillus novofumigatus IBT 16806]
MPQREHLWKLEDDWTGVIDRTRRRQLQNRLNQRAYRQKQKAATGDPSYSFSSSPSNTHTLIPHSSSSIDPTASEEDEDLRCHFAPHNARHIRHAFTILATQSYLTNSPRLEHLLSLFRLNVHRAINENIRILCMTPAWLQPDDALSIFNYHSNNNLPPPTSRSSEEISIPNVDISTLPESLRPTALQRLIPHHPWLDFFPMPEMRDRLIVAAATGQLDEDELCRDLMAFWDTRNSGATLVVTEEFVKKWRWAVMGLGGLVRSTNYWRGRRGREC